MSQSTSVLIVKTPDELSEISVLNGRCEQIGAGIGKLEQSLTPGLYKVRVRVGSAVSDRLVSLDQNRAIEFTADELSFPTPVPLAGTSMSREAHERAAGEMSASAPKDLRTGSIGETATILIFARDWSVQNRAESPPLAGLTLHDENGAVMLRLEDAGDVRHEGDVCAGVRVAVTSGASRLRLTLPDGTAYERSIISVGRWETQVFMLMRDFGDARRADLASGAIVMSQTPFDPSGRGERAAVLARYALTQNRKLAGAVYRELYKLKFDDPILGLLAAHLLLRDSPTETQTIETVLGNLRGLIGTSHPDVQALELARRGSTPHALRFPPLLRASWNAIVAASVTSEVTIAQESPAESVEKCVTAAEPWLVWRADERRCKAQEARLTALRDFLVAYAGAAMKDDDTPRSRTFAFTDEPEVGLSVEAASLKDDPDTKVQLAQSLGVTGSTLDSMLDAVSALKN